MLRILNDEDGFDIKPRELVRVRSRHRWLLRTPNSAPKTAGDLDTIADVIGDSHDPHMELDLPLGGTSSGLTDEQQRAEVPGNGQSPELAAKQRERLQQLEAQSALRWETRKRRRRTRGWAGLPADPPGPPRFPSETTIDEGRAILGLDLGLYREIRSHFARICEDQDVSKKTIAGPERWEGVKDRLIQEVPHLQSVMWMDKEDASSKKLALDVICTDVTKRMRTMETKMTIADAKKVLGSNPEETRTIRQEFLKLLKEDRFTSKTEAGQEHWDGLKKKWTGDSNILQRLLAEGTLDPMHGEKLRAVEILATDVMKRLRDDQTKRDPSRKKQVQRGNTPLPMGVDEPPQHVEISTVVMNSPDHDDNQQLAIGDDYAPSQSLSQYHHMATPMITGTPNGPSRHVSHDASQLQRQERLRSPEAIHHGLSSSQVLSHSPSHDQTALIPSSVLNSGLPIDPQINSGLPVMMASHSPGVNSQHAHTSFLAQDLSPGMTQAQTHSYVQGHFGAAPAPRPPVAVYLRLHPSSPITMAPPIWIATLAARSFEELRQVAVKDMAGTVCGRVEGILGEGMTIEISRDDELTAFLAVIEGRSTTGTQGAPCFYVQILAAQWKT
ncbi:uncharacterized protein JN550_004338 [Neoarthrinium moseri]|uniref:uncharacterized protein n=1 Tax=Neoarthrinium moseri TaxID=1658444 RepID=UPI001FDB80B3|nr:uncharacterized protein JN550_004338 [Neoarthrinium moseri]KAI1872135.1 hypothetical protein JN550_004338 [Neoarthrinium moseri]